ncbi:MAG TPA: heparan-alpha-glucosaminide N-acetyltransferase domain-containing protein [Vicinamibacteria bacterium]|nr:heparan-alpha-glucosaminide N-acetyltransferase domain-containing protein [Vicinamibacteria bacterium]
MTTTDGQSGNPPKARPPHEATANTAAAAAVVPSQRVATIDWMRGFVMVLMIIDHASMAFDGTHVATDSAYYPDATTLTQSAFEFLTRWMTHLCAPTFVFLAGTSLALSIERRVARGVAASEIDRSILTRGAIIAVLDLTVISLGSGHWNFGVLYAIGLSMICMTWLRRLPSWGLCAGALGWMALGELVTGAVWSPPGSSSVLAALTVASYRSDNLTIHYPLVPWLAIMMLGWVFGRHLIRYAGGGSRVSGKAVLWVAGITGIVVFLVVRYYAGYGDMFLPRADDSWQQWLHVSKYPPSLSYAALELGILYLCLAALRTLEPRIGVRPNGVLLVFGETAMFYYLVHRMVLEVPATWFGLRGVGDITTTYVVAAVLLVVLYPACLWYRGFKKAHRDSILQYF